MYRQPRGEEDGVPVVVGRRNARCWGGVLPARCSSPVACRSHAVGAVYDGMGRWTAEGPAVSHLCTWAWRSQRDAPAGTRARESTREDENEKGRALGALAVDGPCATDWAVDGELRREGAGANLGE